MISVISRPRSSTSSSIAAKDSSDENMLLRRVFVSVAFISVSFC